MRSLFCSLILLIGLSVTYAEALRLPTLVGDHMVLQQSSEVAVWGWGEPGDSVTVEASWSGDIWTSQVDQFGKWKRMVDTPDAGGPYEITIADADETIVLKDVLIGEVWVCSGQSNMEMPMRGFDGQPIRDAHRRILNSRDRQLRLFNATRRYSEKPLDDLSGAWELAHPASVSGFSAVGYGYGKLLRDQLDVPVGLIHISWGGTPIEAWMDAETLSDFPEDSRFGMGEKAPQRKPSWLYNALVNPTINFGIKGAIWYQGESNRNFPEVYDEMMAAMIGNWRAAWDRGDFPFYFVQIAPFEYGKGINSAFLREAQLKAMQSIPNVGMAVTMDLGEKRLIHPGDKWTVSERLAYWALVDTYEFEGIAKSGPVYRAVEFAEDGSAALFFDYAEFGLASSGSDLSGFTMAGEDRVFHPAKAKVARDGTLRVTSDSVSSPVAVRYAWENWVEASLFDTFGLPASSFRTDDWPREEAVAE